MRYLAFELMNLISSVAVINSRLEIVDFISMMHFWEAWDGKELLRKPPCQSLSNA